MKKWAEAPLPLPEAALKAQCRESYRRKEWDAAFAIGMEILAYSPNHDDTWEIIQHCAPHVSYLAFNTPCMDRLQEILERVPSNPMIALRIALQAVCVNTPVLSAMLQLIHMRGESALQDTLTEDICRALRVPVLLVMLQRYAMPLVGLERLLTLLRRRLLAMLDENDGKGLEAYREELLSLAYQAHVNEYVYYQTPEEQERVSALRAQIEAGEITIPKLLLFSCYQSPVSLNNAELFSSLAKNAQNKAFEDFIRVTVSEILEEREIAKAIPVLTMSEDAISMAVREQYEENPYPRWMGMGDIPAEHTSQIIRRLFPRFDQSQIDMSDRPEILIAGCGTGKHGVGVARRFKNSHVTAVDLSRASLAYGIRKCREYNIQSIDFHQADILKLGEIGRTFDSVESCGVLHHMRDPMEGWRILTNLVKPGGLMKIGLYSSTARRELTVMREEIKEKGYGDNVQEIRRFRHDIMQNPQMHALYPFTLAGDFYSLSECRDLLFHRQEHCFSLPQIKECLKELGLVLMGFELTNVELIEEYIQRFPEELYWNDLDNWHKIEQDKPLSFFGMYQFWCYKPL